MKYLIALSFGIMLVTAAAAPAESLYQDLKASVQKLQQSLHESTGRESAVSSAMDDLIRSLIYTGEQHKKALQNANDLVDAAQLREQIMGRKLLECLSKDE